MGKRQLIFCDLTKQEISETETMVSVTFKIPGKKTGRTYELSPKAAAKLEQQLVSGNQLPEDWSFLAQNEKYITRREPIVEEQFEPPAQESSDEQLIAEKNAARQEADESLSEEIPEPTIEATGCLHINKSRPHLTIRKGERYAYRICKDCRQRIPEHKLDDRASYASGKLPPDITLKDTEN
jgi:hypothetical protein